MRLGGDGLEPGARHPIRFAALLASDADPDLLVVAAMSLPLLRDGPDVDHGKPFPGERPLTEVWVDLCGCFLVNPYGLSNPECVLGHGRHSLLKELVICHI